MHPERFVLAHSYGYQESATSIRPSQRGLMQACALWILEHQYKIDSIFIAGGHLWGESYPSLAEVLKEESIKIGVSIPIYTKSIAADTPQEIDTFLERAESKFGLQLIFLANRTHLLRVRQILNSRHVKVLREPILLATEDILTEAPYFQTYVDNFANSKEEKEFQKRELQVRMAYRFGLERLLTAFAQKSRKKKFQPKFDK